LGTEGTNKMKNKLIFAAVAVLALSPPALYAGNGYGEAVVKGLIEGGIQAAMNPRTVVVEKRVVVHDRQVVHDQKATTKKAAVKTTKVDPAKVDPKAAPSVAPAPVAPAPVTPISAPVVEQPKAAPQTPVPVVVVAPTPVPVPTEIHSTKNQTVAP
jgi:hypothetical protein